MLKKNKKIKKNEKKRKRGRSCYWKGAFFFGGEIA